MDDPTAPQSLAPIPRPRPISPRSREIYAKKFRGLLRYSSARRTPDGEPPVPVSALQVAKDLLSRTDIKRSSRQLYRSVLLWQFRSKQDQAHVCRQAYWLLVASKFTSETRHNRGRATIPEADYRELLDKLTATAERSRWSCRTQWWVQATLATGLRPIEWMSAHWANPEKTLLRAVTAKAKLCGPAFLPFEKGDYDDYEDEEPRYLPRRPGDVCYGPAREIPVDNAFDRSAIEAHMAHLQANTGVETTSSDPYTAFNRYYNICRMYLRRACDRIWSGERRYTFYTMRRQFSANQRALRGSAAASVLLGHSDPSSPTAAHYGKANQAHMKFKGLRPTLRQCDWLSEGELHAQRNGSVSDQDKTNTS